MPETIDYERPQPPRLTLWNDPKQTWKLALIVLLIGTAGLAFLFMLFMKFVFEAD